MTHAESCNSHTTVKHRENGIMLNKNRATQNKTAEQTLFAPARTSTAGYKTKQPPAENRWLFSLEQFIILFGGEEPK
jgi:hypothetical protein